MNWECYIPGKKGVSELDKCAWAPQRRLISLFYLLRHRGKMDYIN